jgi:TatD DNase family protein
LSVRGSDFLAPVGGEEAVGRIHWKPSMAFTLSFPCLPYPFAPFFSGMGLELYDSHNHLQDERLRARLDEIMAAAERESIVKMVVNGSCESDWAEVSALARRYPQVIPSFGYHPWYVKECSANWQGELQKYLDQTSGAVGEIGLDRWIKDYDLPQQEQVFVWQLRLAAERNVPVSIHCLKAWGKLYDILRTETRPRCGFLLHSYGGPQELIEPLAKVRQRETFRHVPAERLLIETDAPDQSLPSERIRYPLNGTAAGTTINHPANLRSVYEFVAELLDEPLPDLAKRVQENFLRLFGALAR